EESAAICVERRAHGGLDVAALRPDAGHEEHTVGRQGADAPRFVRIRRGDHEPAALARKPFGTPLHDALVERPTGDLEILEVARAGIAGSRQYERVAPWLTERRD